jgi:hypothetical protein
MAATTTTTMKMIIMMMVMIMMMIMTTTMMMMMIMMMMIIICRTARLLSMKVEFMNYAWDSFLFSRKEIVNVPANLGRRV